MYSSIVTALNSRMSRVSGAARHTFTSELSSLRAFIGRTAPLLAITRSIGDAAPEFHPSEWLTGVHPRRPEFPKNEAEYMKLIQYLIERLVTDMPAIAFGHHLFGEGSGDRCCSRIADELVRPYVDYLIEGLGTDSDILYMLARYAQRVEWFTRDDLFAAYSANTSKGEETYDRDLREFLFEQGIDNPYSTPRSPSGRADVVALLHTADPLVCEVKLYNGSGYGVPYIAKGLKQAHRYASDYGKHAAHLVVFNLSGETLQFPSDHPDDVGPPSISVATVRVYLHAIQGKALGAASQPGKIDVRQILRSELVGDLEDASGSEPSM